MPEKLPHSNPLDSFYTSRDWSQHGADPGVLSQVVKVTFLGVVAQVGQLSAHTSAPVHVVPDFWFRIQACEHHRCQETTT